MTTPAGSGARSFDAWHLPGVDVADGDLRQLRVGELACRYPAPSPALLEAVVAGLREAGRALRDRPVAEIVDVIDAAAARLLDPDDPLRRQALDLLPAATGCSPPMATLVLDRMAADWRADGLRMLLTSELGDPAVLDGFAPRPVGHPGPGDGGGADSARLVRAHGPGLALHVFAGNVPGVAVTSLVRALLVKAPSLGKLASDQPVLPVLFARAVASVDPDLARALAVTYWPGGDEVAESRALAAADAVIVYGGDEVVASYRARARAGTRLVVHGPRFSVGLVSSDALRDDPTGTAEAAAAAVAAFDQRGCVSPHAIWVEGEDADVAGFAGAVGAALASLEETLPRGRISAGEASAIQQERAAAELKGHGADGAATRVFTGEGTTWTVIYDADPTFTPSCLNRLIRIHPVARLEDVPPLLEPVGRLLQSVAIAAPARRRAALAEPLARAGATRITTFDRLPWPPPDWLHDGRGPLRELLRWREAR